MTKSNNILSKKSTKEIISEIFSYLKKQLKALYIFTWSPRGIMLFIGILIITVGANLQKDLLDYILIVPILSKFTFTGFVAQVIFSISAIVILIGQLVLIKNTYRPSFGESYLWLIFIGGYTISRFELFEATKWNFISLWRLEEVYVLDILYISFLLPVFLALYTFVGCIPRLIRKILYWRGYQSPTSPTFFTEDIPIGNGKNAEISPTYKTLGENLANKLTNQVFKEAFSVGIIGPWGSGKSSFINHVLDVAEKQTCGNKTIEVIRFYPAFNHSPEQIINDFFTTLIDSLKQYDGRLKSTLLSYSLKLVEAAVNKKKDFQTILSPDNYLMRKRPVYQLYKDLFDIIEKLPVKPIIVIDDLDRLKAEEILEVLRIIRNTANFPNTVFIVAFDKEFIVQSLQEESKSYSKNYVEKYFQLEMYLPQNKKHDLKTYFHKLLKEFKPPVNAEDTHQEMLQYTQDHIVSKEKIPFDSVITNNRDVIKLFNIFIQHLDILAWKDEIDSIDLLYFSILKSRFSPVIYHLYNNWHNYFEPDKGRWIYQYDSHDGPNENKIIYENKLKSFLSTYHYDFNVRKAELDLLFNLLQELFGDFPKPQGLEEHQSQIKSRLRGDFSKKITAINRTEIYFNLLLSKDELPITTFTAYLRGGEIKEFTSFIKERSEDGKNQKIIDEVNLRLKNFSYSDLNNLIEFQKIIAAYIILDEPNRNVCNIINNLSNALHFADKKIIANEYGLTEFITSTFGVLNVLELELKELFDLWEMIEYSYKNLGNDSESAYFKWGAKTIDGFFPFRRYLVEKAIEVISYHYSKESIFIFQSLKASDIISQEELHTVLKFGTYNLCLGYISLEDFIRLIDAEKLLELGVKDSPHSVLALLSVNIFCNNSISIKTRFKYFEDAFGGYAEKEYENEKLGVSTQQEVIEIRKAMVLEFLQQSNIDSVTAMELCLSQLKLQLDKTLAEKYKFVLLNDINNLKVFINSCIVQESFSTYTVNRNINDVFSGEQNFIAFLNDSAYSKDPFVLEFLEFHKINIVLLDNFDSKHHTVFNLKFIEPLESRKSPSIGLSWAEFRIFEVLDTDLISNVVDTHKNDLSEFSLDKKYFLFNDKTTRLWYELIDKYNITKGIKEFGTPGGRRVSENDNKAVMDYGDLKYVDEKLYLGETIIAKEYYYCKYKLEI